MQGPGASRAHLPAVQEKKQAEDRRTIQSLSVGVKNTGAASGRPTPSPLRAALVPHLRCLVVGKLADAASFHLHPASVNNLRGRSIPASGQRHTVGLGAEREASQAGGLLARAQGGRFLRRRVRRCRRPLLVWNPSLRGPTERTGSAGQPFPHDLVVRACAGAGAGCWRGPPLASPASRA